MRSALIINRSRLTRSLTLARSLRGPSTFARPTRDPSTLARDPCDEPLLRHAARSLPLRRLAARALRRSCATATADATPSAASSSSSSSGSPSAVPSYYQLLLHARLAAVPMVGFGFMDNIIMIEAGDFIDAKLGVTLGISTLTAAALGNVCSDSSGVLFGGLVETASARLRLASPGFTAAQAAHRLSKLAATGGSLVGVICGCLLGMSTLVFRDLEATERLKRAQQLETIFEPVMKNCQSMVQAERCTLYLYDEEKRELWTKLATVKSDECGGGRPTSMRTDEAAMIIKLKLDAGSLASYAARTGVLLNIPDARDDPRHDSSWDAKTGFRTRAVLCFPIIDEEGKLYGCIQAVNKVGGGVFTSDDEKLMRMLSSHISIFVEAVAC